MCAPSSRSCTRAVLLPSTAMASSRPDAVSGRERDKMPDVTFGGRFATGASLPPNAGNASTATTRSSTSSRDTGHVELVVRNLEWFMNPSSCPPYTRVSARWWGDDLVDDSSRPWVSLDSRKDSDATFVFPVVAKPAGFARYVKDAAHLTLEFMDGRSGRVFAIALVDIGRLRLGHPVVGGKPLRTRGGSNVGSVHVALRVDFHPKQVSSFELNEAVCADALSEGCDVTDGGEVSEGGDGGGDDANDAGRPAKSPDVTRRKQRQSGTTSHVSPRRVRKGFEKTKDVGTLPSTPTKPLSVLKAAELLRDDMDQALAFDGVSAEAMIDEEIESARRLRSKHNTRTSKHPQNRRKHPIGCRSPTSIRYRAWVKSAATIDSNDFDTLAVDTSVTSVQSDDTTISERLAATEWLGGTSDDPDGLSPDADDAAVCAEEALFSALARFEVNDTDDTKLAVQNRDETKNENGVSSDAVTEHFLAQAEATLLTDAQLGDDDGPPFDPGLEIRLTLHNGSVRALDGIQGVASSSYRRNTKENKTSSDAETQSLVVIVKGGHPFPSGELARVSIDGVGSKGSGAARVSLPSEVTDAIVDATRKTPVLALEVWDPKDLTGTEASDKSKRTGKQSRQVDHDTSDPLSISFAALFGDFTSADPRAMRGVVAVPLDALKSQCRSGRSRFSDNKRWGLEEEDAQGAGDDNSNPNTHPFTKHDPPLNRVFEIKGLLTGDANGFLGVEAGIVTPQKTKAQKI